MNKNKILSLLCAGAIAVTCSCNDTVTTVDPISVLSPDGSRIISLNNSEVTDYVNNYYLGSSLNYLDKTKGDHYFPEPVEIKWVGEKNGNYLVSVSEKEDFSDSRTYTTTSPELKIENLYGGQKYFYKIEDTVSGKTSGVKTFATKKAPRTLKIDGVSNTRDVGGYDVSGKRVKQGMVYRGATPENISEEGKKTFAGLGIKTIIDLRGSAERKRNFSDINYVELPEKGGPYYASGDRNFTMPEYIPALIQSLKVFANADNYPIYFHCQIGRDRTGTLAFILNGLLGADYGDLCMDYELSCFSEAGCLDYDDKTKQVERMVSNTEGMRIYFGKYAAAKKYDGDDAFHFGLEAFLLDNGLTQREISAIRDIMLK